MSADKEKAPGTPTAQKVFTKIADLVPKQMNVNCVFVVLEKVSQTNTREGNVIHHILVADSTGCINASLFDAFGEHLHPGDIARLTNGHCMLHKKALTLYGGTKGLVEVIGEFSFPSNESVNMSRFVWTQNGSTWVKEPPPPSKA
mmetsp:Transcript_34679/g.79091  ORF Transcript_34679/g.79091 Transcript_34679/m.79091 type:complete len:145 (+) Transcript_34679:2-436(+)